MNLTNPAPEPGLLRRMRSRLARAGERTDALASRLARLAIGPFLWPVPIAMGAGVGAWMWRYPQLIGTLDTNKLPRGSRHQMLLWVGLALAGFIAIYLLGFLGQWLRDRRASAVGWLSRLNAWLSFLMALPLVGYLRLDKIETTSPKLAVFCITLAAAAVARSVYALPLRPPPSAPVLAEIEDPPPGPRRSISTLVRDILPAVAVLGLWVAYGWFFTRLSIINHHALNTRTTDLGYYDNIFYQSLHGKFLGCSFIKGGWHGSAHFDPILVLLSPLYLIQARAETLLALQSFWLGAGVVPVYLLAREKLGSPWVAVGLALCWTLYPALHGANMYEFHSLTLINPLVVWLLYFFETGRIKSYYAMMAVLLLCREDIPLLLCFIGFYALVSGRSFGGRVGRHTILLSLLYFALVKGYLMSSGVLGEGSKDSYSYTYYYEELIPDRSSAKELVISLITNPTFALKLMFEDAKLNFLCLLFVPLLALPLFARQGRVMMVYGLAFCLLASRDPVYTVHFQYTSVLTPILFALAPAGLAELRDRWPTSLLHLDGARLTRAAAAACVVSTALISWKFGGIADNQAFRGGFGRVTRRLTQDHISRHAWMQEQIARIPRHASVAATGKMGPHISNRKEAFFYPDRNADFAILDEGELKDDKLARHKRNVSSGDYVELARQGRMVLLHRVKSNVKPLQ